MLISTKVVSGSEHNGPRVLRTLATPVSFINDQEVSHLSLFLSIYLGMLRQDLTKQLRVAMNLLPL